MTLSPRLGSVEAASHRVLEMLPQHGSWPRERPAQLSEKQKRDKRNGLIVLNPDT